MLDTQNQGPQCTACGSAMRLTTIEPSTLGQDLRTFTCPECKRVQRHIKTAAKARLGESAPDWCDRSHPVLGGTSPRVAAAANVDGFERAVDLLQGPRALSA